MFVWVCFGLVLGFFPEVTGHKSERCQVKGTAMEKDREQLLHIIFVPHRSGYTSRVLLTRDSFAYNCQKIVISPQNLELNVLGA